MKLIKSLILLILFGFTSIAAAHPSWSVVEDEQGNLYYSDLEHVWRVAPDGTREIAVANVHTHELHIDEQGRLLGEHLWFSGGEIGAFSHRVWRLERDGQLRTVSEAKGLRREVSFVRDKSGTMYWHDGSRLFARKPSGESALHSVQSYNSIDALFVSPSGHVALIDQGALVLLNDDGSPNRTLNGFTSGHFTQPMVAQRHRVLGMWSSANGDIYAAQFGARRIDRVSQDGEVDVVARTRLPWSPTGGIETRSGDVWLLEYSVFNQARLRKLGDPEPISWSFWVGLIAAIATFGFLVSLLIRKTVLRR